MSNSYGASPAEWSHFDLILGIGADLLPVVSDHRIVISAGSKMAGLGKTPSRLNTRREASGILEWTQHTATDLDLQRWASVPEYGICIQTRNVRALDVDIPDPQEAKQVREALDSLGLPCRFRANSSKFLLAFRLPGEEYRKRTIRTKHGIIEFLAGGNQFIAIGAHFNNAGQPSGARYRWAPALPAEIPTLTPERFEAVWAELQLLFGVTDATAAKATVKKQTKLIEANENDETAKHLVAIGSVLSGERDGRLHIVCPFADEHTGESAHSATTYFPANTGGFQLGHFKCLHAHCAHRTDKDFRDELGLRANDFEDLTTQPVTAATPTEPVDPVAPFTPQTIANFLAEGKDTEWLIKGVLPKAELAFIYGEPSSGKTFLALDIAMSIAKGLAWNERKTQQGRVLYVAAENAEGVRKRVKAYQQHYGADPGYDNLQFISSAPMLHVEQDRKALWQAIRPLGPLDVIVLDTLAAVTPGIEENSSKDYGPVLHYCKQLHARIGCLVLFVHHVGKDPTKGMRGSSILLGAADCQIFVERFGDERVATIAKLKNSEDKAAYGFKLKVVELGRDVDGDLVTSCVVEYLPPGSAKPVTTSKDSVGRLVLNLAETMTLVGSVTVNDLIEGVVAQLPHTEAGKKDTRTRRAQVAYEGLLADGYLTCTDGRVAVS